MALGLREKVTDLRQNITGKLQKPDSLQWECDTILTKQQTGCYDQQVPQ